MGIPKINKVDFFDRRQGLWIENFCVDKIWICFNGLYDNDLQEGEQITLLNQTFNNDNKTNITNINFKKRDV